MKRLLLINANTETNPYPVPPLGLCLSAGAAGGACEVRVYDGAFDRGEGLARAVDEFRPDYAGIGIRNIDSMEYFGGRAYMEGVRDGFVRPLRELTGAPLILGGSGFSILPGPIMRYLDADYGIAGESEAALPLLLGALGRGNDPSGIPGVIARGEREPARGRIEYDFSTAAPSGIDRLIDLAPYRARGAYPVQTKRGCAHRCVYCTYTTVEGTRFRPRDPSAVAREVADACGRAGDMTFEFVDSTFNDPPGHAEAVCRELIAAGAGARLRTMGVNPAGAGPALMDLMRGAGFAQVDCTPDSASPAMLRSLGKNFTREDLDRAARAIRESGMPVMWFFLFGGPGENERTFGESMEFVDAMISPLDMVHITMGLRVYPGTALHGIAVREGTVTPDDDLLDPRFYVSPALGEERLRALIDDACRARDNCVPAWESTPPPDMLREAAGLRAREKLDEPMFRTLLRVRASRRAAERGEKK